MKSVLMVEGGNSTDSGRNGDKPALNPTRIGIQRIRAYVVNTEPDFR